MSFPMFRSQAAQKLELFSTGGIFKSPIRLLRALPAPDFCGWERRRQLPFDVADQSHFGAIGWPDTQEWPYVSELRAFWPGFTLTLCLQDRRCYWVLLSEIPEIQDYPIPRTPANIIKKIQTFTPDKPWEGRLVDDWATRTGIPYAYQAVYYYFLEPPHRLYGWRLITKNSQGVSV